MLVITRKNHEALCIGHDIEVAVLDVHDNRVELGINAPKDLPVHRREPEETVVHAPTTPAAKQTALTRVPDHGTVADRELQGRIRVFLKQLNLPSLNRVQVDIQDGVAVVSGRVGSFYQKQLATSCCQRVAGVLSVHNEVQVADSPEQPRMCEDDS